MKTETRRGRWLPLNHRERLALKKAPTAYRKQQPRLARWVGHAAPRQRTASKADAPAGNAGARVIALIRPEVAVLPVRTLPPGSAGTVVVLPVRARAVGGPGL